MTRIIVAGFGPFPGASTNPSALLVKALARRRRPALGGVELASHVFATAYAAVDRDLPKLLAARPDIVLMFGLAGRRRQVCIETRSRNAVSVLLPDADGYRPPFMTIVAAGPSSRRGNSPFTRLLSAARTRVPARLSRDAGRYLCNYAYWQALHRTEYGHPLVAFVHIPSLPRAPRRPGRHRGMSLPRLIDAAEALLIALIAASRR